MRSDTDLINGKYFEKSSKDYLLKNIFTNIIVSKSLTKVKKNFWTIPHELMWEIFLNKIKKNTPLEKTNEVFWKN